MRGMLPLPALSVSMRSHSSGAMGTSLRASPQPPAAASPAPAAQPSPRAALRATAAAPQRVPSPPYLNSPRRSARSFGGAADGAGGADGATGAGVAGGSAAAGAAEAALSAPLRMARKQAELLASRTTLRDCQMLAEASRRAGRTRMEGQCYFRMGVLCDNVGDYAAAVEHYKKFLLSCRRTGDTQGEALALNRLGVDYQQMGAEHMHRAVACHTRHRDVGDTQAKYVAHCNLGLLFMEAGRHDRAADNFRHALRYAIRLGNLSGEKFAYEHLSAAGLQQGDVAFARQCMERSLALATTMGDSTARHAAFSQLGRLAGARGDFDEATRCFSASLEVAQQQQPQDAVAAAEAARQVRCELGVALGNATFEDFMGRLSQELQPRDL
jgi:tetratricopeptide (TPR) repeat protein